MKKKIPVPAVAILILAALAAAGVKTVLGPCVHEDGSFGSCHWAGQAVFGTAVLLAAQSLCSFVIRQDAVRRGLYLAMMLTAVLGLMIPGTLIGLCGMATMRCCALMRPAVTILFSLAAIFSLAGFLTGRTSRMNTGA